LATAPSALSASARVARVGAAPDGQRLQLVLPLTADDAGLAQFALAVSTPGSALYGRYQSIPTLARRFGASSSAKRRVIEFLRAHGATEAKVDGTGMLAEATMTVGLAQRVFGTRLSSWRAADGTRFVAPAASARAASVSVPAALRGLITGVVGLDTRPVVARHVPRLAGARSRSTTSHATAVHRASDYPFATGTPGGCADGVGTNAFTPNQYLTAYDYGPLRASRFKGKGQRVAVIEIDGFKLSDIDRFANCFGLDRFALTTYYGLVGHPLPPGTETTLDLEVLDAVAPNLDEVEVFESGADQASLLKAAVAPLLTPNAKPQVISESLGQCEAFQDPAGIKASERALKLAASTGITYMASSGDHGTANCQDISGAQHDQLGISYPASSPWVTSVGGTNFTLNASNQISAQQVWNDGTDAPGWGGGGGYSAVFKRPSYQNGVVTQNARATPDVSMLADTPPGYAIYCTATDCLQGGGLPWQGVGGTSAAAPLLAGGAALVDQDLHAKGKAFLGFVNPLLYAIGKSSSAARVFSDVTVGNNDVGATIVPGNGQALGCCTATPGYDAASGWGSLDLAHFDQVATILLPKIANVSLTIPAHQKPVSAHKINGRLSCSTACTASAFVVIKIEGAKSFTVDTAIYDFKRAGTQSVSFKFSGGQVGRLRSALAKHRHVFAEAFGVAFDPGGQIAKVTAGRQVVIRG
jgi:subtilase family serine protease